MNGNIRITATAKTPARPGKPLGVTFRITNVSKQPRMVQLGYPENLWFVMHIPNNPSYDSRFLTRFNVGGPSMPTKLRPGQSVTRSPSGVPVSWSGPLRIVAGFNGIKLPALNVPVVVPSGRLPSDRAAVAEVLASTGHLLDDCRPSSPGIPVIGEIKAPHGSAPPLRARCSVDIEHERGFLSAQVLIATPPAFTSIHLQQPYEQFTVPKPLSATSREMTAWLFVVTHAGVISTDSTGFTSARPGKQWVPDWQWTTNGFERGSGTSRCGWLFSIPGGGSRGPIVQFVSICG